MTASVRLCPLSKSQKENYDKHQKDGRALKVAEPVSRLVVRAEYRRDEQQYDRGPLGTYSYFSYLPSLSIAVTRHLDLEYPSASVIKTFRPV